MALKGIMMLALLGMTYALPAEEVQEVIAVPVQAEAREDLVVAADNSGGWGQQAQSQGWGWQPQPQKKGWGWPKFKYLKFTIPIPILPRIKFGIKGGLKLNAAIQHPKGWGWSG